MRKLILSAALVTASLFGMTAQAADVPLEAGKTYVELANPVPVSVPGKIEVVELFWYGCPHCYSFEPTINPWAEKLPSDVNFIVCLRAYTAIQPTSPRIQTACTRI